MNMEKNIILKKKWKNINSLSDSDDLIDINKYKSA